MDTMTGFNILRVLMRFRPMSLLVLALLSGTVSAVSVSASPTNCTSVAGIGTVNWTNPARAVSSNNSYATASVDGTTTRYLQCTGYNFAIPAGATINGITVNVERRSSSTANGGSRDAAMRLLKAGVIGATDRSTATTYTTADVIQAHGGAADLWGAAWTPADINAANFGAAFAATKPNAAGAAHTVSVDHVQITVDYTPSVTMVTVFASPTNCTSVAGIGTVNWTNPARAVSSNNSYATASVDGTTTRYLQCTGYNFAIPAGATINGITVNVERRSSSTANGGSRDAAMRLLKAGVIGATDRSTATTYTTADVIQAHGGAADLWGDAWTPADINAANFGAAFAATKASAAGAAHTVRVDHVQIGVTYTIAAAPDHILITHSGSALTCTPKTVTITACANASCSTLYTAGGLTVTLTPGGQTFAIGVTGINAAATVQQAAAGAATLGAVSSPLTVSPTTCLNTSNGSASCVNAMQFNTSGFIVTAPDHVACSNTAVTIEAVQQGTPANRCVPAYAGVTRPVNLNIAYSNPLSGTKSVTDVANGTLIGTAATAHNLTFDATGRATLTVSYPDAGQLTLIANDTAPTGAAMTGNTQFIAAPAAFAISGVTAGPIKAGNNFAATLTAQTSTGGACAVAATATNFGNETAPQSAALTFAKCLPGGTASSSGLFSGSATFSNGVASVNNLNWSEVGNGDVVAGNSGYLGSALAVAGNTGTGGTVCNTGVAPKSGNVGNFVPDHFDTAIINGCLGCGFTYSGQPFTLSVTAMNGLPAPTATLNYDGSVNTSPNFANAVLITDANALATPVGKLGVSAAALGVTANAAGTTLTVPKADFVSGVAMLASVPVYTFDAVTTPPTIVKMRATDSVYAAVTSSAFVEGTVEIRSGRFKISNAYGSELLPLTLTVSAQYYQGAASGWLTSVTDSSTSFNSALGSAGGNLNTVFVQGPLAAVTVLSPATAAVANGTRAVTLAAPGLGVTGAVDLSLNAPAYMLAGSNGAGANPSVPGRATFGLYRGNNPYIYQREAY